MNILKKIQAYRDKRFLARLERVLQNNVVKSRLVVDGAVVNSSTMVFYLPKAAMEDIASGTPLSLVLERSRQGYYGQQEGLQSGAT